MNLSFNFILERIGMEKFLILQSIRQKSFYHEAFPEDLKELESAGYIEKMKNGSYKTTNRGNSFLEQATEGFVDPDTIELADSLIKEYETRGKAVGKKKEIESRLSWFIGASYFSNKAIYDAVVRYLDTHKEYTMTLENLIWKQPSLMAVHKNLKDSMLFNEIMSHNKDIDERLYFDPKFMDSTIKWLIAVSKLPAPPSGMPEGYYLSGSRTEDKTIIARIKMLFYKKLKKQQNELE